MARMALKRAVAVCMFLSGSAYSLPFPAEPTLKVGDTAPIVRPAEWLKGQPITQYARGRVYVVEFWATWCPPCIKSIPHLSELQKDHANKLTIIGIDVDGVMGGAATPASTVYDFVKKHAADMQYTVAMEDLVNRPMSKQWVSGTGSMGVPVAVIIDQWGKVAWIGYPDVTKGYAFDDAVKDVLAGKVDSERAKALQAATNRDTVKYWSGKTQ